MRTYKTEAIVIKRRSFLEKDRIITIFTKHNGKISVRAQGVRKITSRRSPHIELLNHCVLTLYKGKNLPLLIEAQTLNNFEEIKNNLTKVGFSYHICELVDGLCAENQENEVVFSLLQNTLVSLSKENDIATIIHGFEVELLAILGFWPRSRSFEGINTQNVIERILERKLKSKPLIPKLS